MKVTHDRFKQAVCRFANENVIPKINLPDEKMRGLARFAVGAYIEAKYPEMIETMKQFVLVCDENEVDIDKTEAAVMAGLRASGGSVTLCKVGFTMTFKSEDWASFKRCV